MGKKYNYRFETYFTEVLTGDGASRSYRDLRKQIESVNEDITEMAEKGFHVHTINVNTPEEQLTNEIHILFEKELDP